MRNSLRTYSTSMITRQKKRFGCVPVIRTRADPIQFYRTYTGRVKVLLPLYEPIDERRYRELS